MCTFPFSLSLLLCLSSENKLLTRRDRHATGRERSFGKSNEQICLFEIDFVYSMLLCTHSWVTLSACLGMSPFLLCVTLHPSKSCCYHLFVGDVLSSGCCSSNAQLFSSNTKSFPPFSVQGWTSMLLVAFLCRPRPVLCVGLLWCHMLFLKKTFTVKTFMEKLPGGPNKKHTWAVCYGFFELLKLINTENPSPSCNMQQTHYWNNPWCVYCALYFTCEFVIVEVLRAYWMVG